MARGTCSPAEYSRMVLEKSPIILCIATADRSTKATSVILAQLLEKHGFRSRLVTHDEMSREKIETLDTANVAIVCISCSTSAAVRHICAISFSACGTVCLGVQIIVGIWPSEDAAQRDDAARTAIGASASAASLEETVTQCVQTAIKTADSEAPPPAAKP